MSNNANSNDFLNRTAPEDHIQPETEYPIIQWHNGLPGAAGVLANGGFELPLKHFKDLVAGEILDIPHRNGTVIELGYLLPAMHLAIVAAHTAYYKENGDDLIWSATPKFEEGYRSRTLYFCYAAEIEETTQLTPVVLSVKSRIAQALKALLKQFRAQVLATADQLSGNKSAHYFYYVPVGSAGRETIPGGPQGSYTIAPPTPFWDLAIADLDNEAQLDILRELAIPDYLYRHIINQGWDEAKAWQEAMEAKGNGGDNAPPAPPQDPAPISPANEAPAPPPAPSPPMSEAQAVAAAQAEATTMSNEEARRRFQASVGEAIVNRRIDHVTASKLANDANSNGWLGALATLEQAMATA